MISWRKVTVLQLHMLLKINLDKEAYFGRNKQAINREINGLAGTAADILSIPFSSAFWASSKLLMIAISGVFPVIISFNPRSPLVVALVRGYARLGNG